MGETDPAAGTAAGAGSSCATRYPILLVHGAGFRDDYALFGYWGRIPAALRAEGAAVYYGRQDAWGSVRDNALALRDRALACLGESGSGKLNIIAHSKGGLEARYMISSLGMGERVESLTTISTPHRGSKTIDRVCALAGPALGFAALFVNLYYRILGDRRSDFAAAVRELSTRACAEFNRANPDHPGVLYQSYAGKMRNALSDPLFAFSHPIVKLVEGDNDGLVATSSAAWGAYRGLIESGRWRGVSHADLVDAWRMNLAGFDIREVYLRIARELKEGGH